MARTEGGKGILVKGVSTYGICRNFFVKCAVSYHDGDNQLGQPFSSLSLADLVAGLRIARPCDAGGDAH